VYYKAFGEEPPPHKTLTLPGKFLDVTTEEDGDLWSTMWETRQHYFCELCCDEDSYLKTPDGRFIYHRGFRGKSAAHSASVGRNWQCWGRASSDFARGEVRQDARQCGAVQEK
jgi:hypothetical protein